MPDQVRRRIPVSLALALLAFLFMMLSQVQAKSPSTASTLIPTFTLMPTATLDPNAFSLVGAATYKAPNDIIAILLPKAWRANPPTTPGRYSFSVGSDQNPTVILQVQITTPAELISAAKPPTNAKEALQAIRDAFDGQKQSQQLPASTTLSKTVAVKIGKLKGVGFILSVPDEAAQPGTVLDFRITDLSRGRVLFAYSQSSNAAWVRVKQVLARMLDSLVVNPPAIPTATPTSVPNSLELTAISLGNQLSTVEAKIQALTPTETPLPSN